MPGRSVKTISALAVVLALAAAPQIASAQRNVDWRTYGGDSGGTRYSPLKQITKGNVTRLKEAWRFEMPAGAIQAQPTIVGRVMYIPTTDKKVVALDAATGKVIWTRANLEVGGRTRGVTWWESGAEKRLFVAGGWNLYAINPDNGELITTFGENGILDLRKNLRGEDHTKNFVNQGTPVNVYKDVLITGGGVPETSPSSPGDIRGWDVRTGKLLWTFHTIPHPGEAGYETWPDGAYKWAGGANNWAGAVVDDKRGIVFVPTGSGADDFAGPERLGDNLYANTLIALDALTGKKLWHFQTVRHDLWDVDFSTPPILMTVKQGGKTIDAVAATNKTGHVYIFDRVTGTPLFPIQELEVPPTTIPGDVAAKTQPIPTLPAPLGRQSLTADELTKRTPEAAAFALEKFKTFAGGKPWEPPQLNKETIAVPGFSGGVEWGGMAATPDGVLFANSENIVWTTAVTVQPPPREGAPAGFRSAYRFSGYNKFYDAEGYPASAPPWGTLTAIDMNTGKYKWQIPLGYYPELADKTTGTENYGGPVATASGLLFIGATIFDNKLRAIDSNNGKILWEGTLPFAGNATPAIYMVDGKQFVAIGASGARNRKGPQGAAFVAYSLGN